MYTRNNNYGTAVLARGDPEFSSSLDVMGVKRKVLYAVGSLLLAAFMTMYLILNTRVVGGRDSHVESLDIERESTRFAISLAAPSTGSNNSSLLTDRTTLAVLAASTTLKSGPGSRVKSKPTEVRRSMRVGDLGMEETRNIDCNWVNFTVPGPPYFLTAVFIVRIYENDLSELTSAEIKQWLVYLRYAGVEHVYLYDLWLLPGESQREALDVFIREGYLTYTDWHKYSTKPFDCAKSQLSGYQHCIDNYGKDFDWQAAIDIDEYPFSPKDTDPGFMHRFVKKYSKKHSDVSEITMQNYIYLGEKNKSRELLMDRLWRHTHGPHNNLVKPIYKPGAIRGAQIHHNYLYSGKTRDAPDNELRFNHYWGARLQNWGPDTEEIIAMTEEDLGVKPIVAAFKACEVYIRPYL